MRFKECSVVLHVLSNKGQNWAEWAVLLGYGYCGPFGGVWLRPGLLELAVAHNQQEDGLFCVLWSRETDTVDSCHWKNSFRKSPHHSCHSELLDVGACLISEDKRSSWFPLCLQDPVQSQLPVTAEGNGEEQHRNIDSTSSFLPLFFWPSAHCSLLLPNKRTVGLSALISFGIV